MFFKRKDAAIKEAAAVRERPAKSRVVQESLKEPPFKEPPVKAAAVEPDGELDVRALGRALWRRKRSIIIPTLVVTALAVIAVHVIAPHYKSSATILYEGRENIFLRPDADKATADRGPADELALTSQVQLVLSRELALEVIKKLKLTENPEFDPVLKGIPPWKVALIAAGIVRNPLNETAEERVLETYFTKLTAYPLERSRVIKIEFTSKDPKLAARAANAVADGYLDLQQQTRQQQTTGAGDWLQGEIAKLRPRVDEAEAKAETFRSQTNLFLGTNNTTLSNQQLGEFNSQLALARAQKVDAQTRARMIRGMLKSGGPIEASDVLNSDLIRRLSEQRVTLRAQLAEQSATLLDNHPRIKELKAQISDLDKQIRGEAEKVARSLENDSKIADARVVDLSHSLDELKSQAANTNGQDVHLRALDRDAKSLRDLLESYLAKYREATARETIGNAPPDTRIISRAIVSNTPYFPKKLPTILVAFLAALVVSTGFVTTSELMRQSPALPAAVRRPGTSAVAPLPAAPPPTEPVATVTPAPAPVPAASPRTAPPAAAPPVVAPPVVATVPTASPPIVPPMAAPAPTMSSVAVPPAAVPAPTVPAAAAASPPTVPAAAVPPAAASVLAMALPPAPVAPPRPAPSPVMPPVVASPTAASPAPASPAAASVLAASLPPAPVAPPRPTSSPIEPPAAASSTAASPAVAPPAATSALAASLPPAPVSPPRPAPSPIAPPVAASATAASPAVASPVATTVLAASLPPAPVAPPRTTPSPVAPPAAASPTAAPPAAAAPPEPASPTAAAAAMPADYGLAKSPLSSAVTHPALGVPFSAIDDLAARLRASGEEGRRIAVFGVSRNVGTTMSAVTLARALSRHARVVLIDLALGAPNLAAISADPQAPGVGDAVRGMVSFGDVITRDKLSRVHLINAGRIGGDGATILASQRLVMLIEALARTYDHVMIDAGAALDAPVDRFFRLAPRAVLVATDQKTLATQAARDRMGEAGYTDIAALDGAASAAAAA